MNPVKDELEEDKIMFYQSEYTGFNRGTAPWTVVIVSRESLSTNSMNNNNISSTNYCSHDARNGIKRPRE